MLLVSCCAVLYCAVLFRIVLCCAVLCCAARYLVSHEQNTRYPLALPSTPPPPGLQTPLESQEADKFFAKTAKGMNSRYGSWPSNSVRKDLRDEMREFASERLQLVQVCRRFLFVFVLTHTFFRLGFRPPPHCIPSVVKPRHSKRFFLQFTAQQKR